ncbi:MAG: endonuclease/exonuclease/phosphatase family protein [Anaerolineales bacterium]
MTESTRPSLFLRLMKATSSLYLALLFIWFLLYLTFEDGFGYLGLANALAVFFFVPLPLALFSAWKAGDRRLLAAGLLAASLFAWLWGPLFLPSPSPNLAGPRLRVMTINVLGKAGYPEAVLASIQATDPDVVFVQEFTPELVSPLSKGLRESLPYQVLEARVGSNGLAVFSRFPIERLAVLVPGRWKGAPQVLRMDWEGRLVTLVNIHAVSTGSPWPGLVRYTTRERLAALSALADFVAEQDGPVIVAGDANTTRLNKPYKLLDAVLDDAWWEAGWGLGHTFPGRVEPDDWFTRVSFIVIPHWLVRIDHIFYSAPFQARNAALADFYGGSDHRGLVTELVWKQD